MTDLTIDARPVDLAAHRRGARRAAGRPGVRSGLHRPHGVGSLLGRQDGWHDARLGRTQPLTLDPATSALHYGQAIFEGLKAYRQPDGVGRRCSGPSRTPPRFQRSARRLAMAELPERAVPRRRARRWSRPTATGCRAGDGRVALPAAVDVRHRPVPRRPAGSREYLFLLIASPARRLLPGRRASRCRSGSRRSTPGRRPAAPARPSAPATTPPRWSRRPQAAEQGCDQVVWLDAVEHRYVEEMGGMNLYFVLRRRPRSSRPRSPARCCRASPATRSSPWRATSASQVEEGRITTDEWEAGCADGTISEVFACGTAAVVTPVGQVKHAHGVVPRRRRRAGRGDHEAPRGAARHPAGHRVRPARLDAPGRLTPRRLTPVA